MLLRIVLLAIILLAMSILAYAASLNTDCYTVEIDEQGRISKLFNKISQRDYCHGIGPIPVQVYYLDVDKPLPVPMVCHGIEAGNGLQCSYSGSGVNMTLTLSEDKNRPDVILWNVKVENTGYLRLTEIKCPCLTHLRIGKKAANDTLVRPNRYGEKIPNPVKNLFHKAGEKVNGVTYEEWWNSPRLEYAGQAGMFWMDMYDSQCGLYIASEDKSLIGGYLDSNIEDGYISLDLGKYVDISKDESIELNFVTAVHMGDWHRGADLYREWAYSFMEEADMPAWAREMPNWYWYSSIWSMGMQKPKMQAGFDFNFIRDNMYDSAIGLGTGVIGLAGLEFMGHDYPLWHPDYLVGDDNTIIEAVKNVHRRGGRIVPYINPIYAWEDYPNVPHSDDEQFQERLAGLPKDIKQPDWEYYKQFAAKRYNGTHNNVEVHYHGNLPQMCMAAKEWQDYVLWWTHRYADYYGFDGVQWDQLGAYQNTYCLDKNHNHKVSGCATEGISTLCKRIYNDEEYKVSRDFYIWYEGNSDIYGQYLHAGHSGFEMWMAYGFPELIQYTFGRCFMGGEYNSMPGMTKEGLIRAARCVEKSFLGRYKLGTGQNTGKAYKVQKIAPLTKLLKGLYWYTEYQGSRVNGPEGIEGSVLKLRPEICPYIAKGGYVIPICDTRKIKAPAAVAFEGDADIKEALWYEAGPCPIPVPVHWYKKDGMICVELPANTGVNAFDFEQALCRENNTVSALGMIVLTEDYIRPVVVKMPKEAEAGKAVEIETCTVSGREDTAEIILTPENTEAMKPVDAYDCDITRTQKSGRDCWRIKQGPKEYIYIQITDDNIRTGSSYVFEVEYLDGEGAFDIQYNSSDPFAAPSKFGELYPDYKATGTQIMTGTNKWKKAVFTADDCDFKKAMNGNADIRIRCQYGKLYIASVTIKKQTLLFKPAEAVTVRVGNDEITTDSLGKAVYTFRADDPKGWYRVEAYQKDRRNLLPAETVIKLKQ